MPVPRGAAPITIAQATSSPRYSSVAASPKQELWPTIGAASPGGSAGLRQSAPEFQVGAWGRAAPAPPVIQSTAANRVTSEEDHELRAVGPWALGELLVGALGQQKHQQRAGKPNSDAVASNKQQKKAKGKKMVPLFAVGMNRAP